MNRVATGEDDLEKEALEKEYREIKYEDFSSVGAFHEARRRWIKKTFGDGSRNPALHDYFCNLRTQ